MAKSSAASTSPVANLQAQLKRFQRPDPKALLSTGLGVLLLLLGLLFTGQGYSSWRVEQREQSLAASAHAAAGAIAELVAGRQASLERAAGDPGFLQAFREGLAEQDLSEPERRLKAALPELLSHRVLPAPALKSIATDLGEFGYARTEMLLESERRLKAAEAQVHKAPDSEELRLVLTQPVIDEQRMIGHVLAEYALAPVLIAADAHRNGAGGLDLIQGDVQRAPRKLSSLGTSTVGFGGSQVNIPGSRLRLAYGVPEPFVLFGPSSPLVGMSSGLALTLLGVAFVAFRARLESLLQRRDKGGSAPTLREALDAEAADAQDKAGRKGKSKDKDKETAKAAALGLSETAQETADQAAVPPPPPKPSRSASQALSRSIFRAYDIRGVVGQTLTADVAHLLGQAIGSEIRERGLREVVVGRDGRLSGPQLASALIEGLRSTGCEVTDIGAAATPLLYFACHHLQAGSGVMVTGSHNPPDYNGFKIVIDGETVAEDRIQGLYARIAEGRFVEDQPGGVQSIDIADEYIERISSDVQLEMPLSIVVDAGNGIAGAVAPRLLEEIGCEVTPLHCEVDGHFPNHHPDPSVPANLQDLIIAVRQVGADLGVAFDGDGDRLGVVTPSGEIIYPDRLLMLFAQDVLLRNPGATIIYDVKCTGKLAPVILANGGSPVMWKTGHSLIKRRMKELKAALAGEMSGHFFFQERWYGFDDGLYSACRLLEILASSGMEADALFAELPKGHSTPELKIEFAEGEHYRFIQRFVDKASFDGARLTTIDGLRADWDDGWGLVRASNTTPSLVLRFDADDEHALERVKQSFREQLHKLDPGLKLPF